MAIFNSKLLVYQRITNREKIWNQFSPTGPLATVPSEELEEVVGDAVVTSGRSIVGLPMPRSEAWMGWWTTMVDRLEEGLEEGNGEKRKGTTVFVLEKTFKIESRDKFGF